MVVKTFSRFKVDSIYIDNEELTSQDLADAIAQMHEKKRYHELMFMIDTCEAESMYLKIKSPNTLSVASSVVGEPSLSHHNDRFVGVSVIDSFTNFNLETFEHITRGDTKTIKELFSKYDYKLINSHAVYTSLMKRRLEDIKIVDFFGGVQSVELTPGDRSVIDFVVNRTITENIRTIGYSPESEIPQLQDAKSSYFSDERGHVAYVLNKHSVVELIELNFYVGLSIFVAIVVCSLI